MKKMINVILFIGLTVVLSGCGLLGQSDNNAPVVTGDTDVMYLLNSPVPVWTDMVTAIDEEDGEIVVLDSMVVSNVDFTIAGDYTVVITVSDSEDNTTVFTINVEITGQEVASFLLIGASQITLNLNEAFLDPGVKALDTKGNVLDYSIDGTVDSSVVGAYVLTYSIEGLTSTLTRTVNVIGLPAVLEDGDNVYVTYDGIVVTEQELYDQMILSNGLNYLWQYVDEQLFSNYLATITSEQLLAKKDLLTYGTDDQAIIDEFKTDTELNTLLVKGFDDNMVLLGLNPNDMADLKSFLGLSLAKENYVNDYILGLESTDALSISEEDKEEYYEENTVGDVCTVDIRFHSTTEAELVLDHFNIVPNYDGINWGIYDPSLNGNVEIGNVGVSQFNSSNTSVLSEAEAFSAFVKIYNYMNPMKTQIPEDITQTEFCVDFADIASHNYEDMTRAISSTGDAMSYVNYIFNTLTVAGDEDSSTVSYSYKIQSIGDFAVIAYKVSEVTVTPYANLTAIQKEGVLKDLLATMYTSENLEIAMEELMIDNELVIFDRILKLQAKVSSGIIYDNNGSDGFIATLGEMKITSRDVFDYMTENYGKYNALEIAQNKSMLQSDLYFELYSDDTNYAESENVNLRKITSELESFKDYFLNDGFATYNFSSLEYTWEEFLIIYLQCTSETEIYEKISIAGNLQNYLINDSINYESAVAYIQDQVDNYFSLDVEHLLLFIDEDLDFGGDDYSNYLDAMTVLEKAEYDALVSSFSVLIQNKVKNDEMTFEEIVTEYQDSLIGDPTNVWAPFKEAGFYIITQDLSKTASLNYTSTHGYYDDDFVVNLKRTYDAFVLDINQSIEEPTVYNDDRVFETDFGIHYIIATKGDGFEQPSAVFDNSEGEYSVGNSGTTIAPNKEQVELFVALNFGPRIEEATDYTLANSVSNALDAYYSGLFAKYWPTTNNTTVPVTIMTVSYALSHNVTFAENDEETVANLAVILAALIESNFPDTFITE